MGTCLSEPITAMVIERARADTLDSACVTMQGWRRTHEDAHIVVSSVNGELAAGTGVFAVLDGHGGQRAAQVGAKLLREELVRIARLGVLDPIAAREAHVNAFFATDKAIRAQVAEEERSGSTVVAAIITRVGVTSEYQVQLAHCGDSRAVVGRPSNGMGAVLACTEDHKPHRDDEVARIRGAGGHVERGPFGGPMRVDGTLAVSRSLGDFHFKPHEMDPSKCKVTAMPEVQTFRCRAGDWVLLACDGVFDVYSNEEVYGFVDGVLQEAHEVLDCGHAMVRLLQASLDRGSKDNCTACLVRIGVTPQTAAHTMELLSGPWEQAPAEVRAKYADFYLAHGFKAEAQALCDSPEAPPRNSAGLASPAPTSTPAGARPSNDSQGPAAENAANRRAGGLTGGAGARQLSAMARALQAMRSTRAIQSAWRARRDSAGNAGSETRGS
mmetsp:Transcript_15814/g.43239  ORF Transcript_15814/g.43239 Transcript_15814/m.43239 type:complete len:441 (+) Transcript_15814:126-1448(+)